MTDRTATRLGWACLAAALLSSGVVLLLFLTELDLIGWLPENAAWIAVLLGGSVAVALWSLRRTVARRSGNLRLGAGPANAGLVLTVLGPFFGSFAVTACTTADRAGTRALNLLKLQQIAAAIHSYHDRYGALPGPAVLSEDGRPLLSWRVAVLPYVDQQALFDRFRLDEPWDSPHNRELVKEMPAIYQWAFDTFTPAGHTYFQAVVGPGTAFERGGLRIPEDFHDGTWHTILLVEAATAVPWTQPADIAYDPNGPLPALGANTLWRGHRRHAELFLTAMVDGSSRSGSRDISPATLRALFTRNGRDKPGEDRW